MPSGSTKPGICRRIDIFVRLLISYSLERMIPDYQTSCASCFFGPLGCGVVPPTGTTPQPKASAAGARFQATHLHIGLSRIDLRNLVFCRTPVNGRHDQIPVDSLAVLDGESNQR